MSDKEKAIRALVRTAVESYAAAFSERHLDEYGKKQGTINRKIHNVFIAALGADILYYSALSRSLDSSLGNMIEKMASCIASLNYQITTSVEGEISQQQTSFIASLLEQYKTHACKPNVGDYHSLLSLNAAETVVSRKHKSDFYLYDEENDMHYLVELKIGGDLDVKKARSEKEALLEQYCILANTLGSSDNVRIYFATAYNRFGEGHPWKQSQVRQFFAREELLISRDFWNMICKSERGYDIVLDEYRKNAHYITTALDKVKTKYLPDGE